MTKLTGSELQLFENILTQGGYVLDFNDAKFKQFILRTTGIDVHDENYQDKVNNSMGGTSKGKTLTYFIYNESESNVLKLLSELIKHVENIDYEKYGISLKQIEKAKNILNEHETSLEIPTSNSDELKIFISYSSRDYKEANKVYEIFKNAEIDCFLAQYDLKGGINWNPIVLQKLKISNMFILILSENFYNSPWCNQEAGIAFLQYDINDALLIPVYLDDIRPYGLFYDVQGIKYDDFNSLEEFVSLIDTKSFSFDDALEKVEEK